MLENKVKIIHATLKRLNEKRHRGRLLLLSVALDFSSLQAMEAWRLQECWGLPAYSLLPVFLRESIFFHADAAAGTCQSLFLWLALIPPVAVWEA